MLGRLLNICLLLLSLQASAQAWIFEVYGTLTESMGDQRGNFPELRIEEGSEFIARYSNRKNIIYLESLTVSIVDEHFGASRKDALAYILAHELGHFHFNHGWMRRTGERFASKETARELYKIGISKQQLLVDEAAADAYAGVITVLSGYNSIQVAEELLEVLYKKYEVPDQMEGYLSLKERKEIIQTIDEYVEGFMPVYWGGNYALLIGNYQAARGCFEYMVQRQMGSSEIYNNLGLACLMEARKVIPEASTSNYLLPLVDNQGGVTLPGVINKTSANALLKKATNSFEKSIDLRKSNYPAYLNMVTAYDLLYLLTNEEDYLEDARYWLRKASRLEEVNEVRIGFLSEVVATAEENRRSKSLKEAVPDPSSVMDPNLRSAIGGEIDFKEQLDINGYILDFHDRPNSTFYRFRPPSVMAGTTTIMFEAYKNFYQPSPSGVYIGVKKKDLISRMGEPEEQITDGPNTFYGYESRNIIYRLRRDKVTGWVNYRNINAR